MQEVSIISRLTVVLFVGFNQYKKLHRTHVKPDVFVGKPTTRGPKGPWVAHLRKRSKVTVEPFTEDY